MAIIKASRMREPFHALMILESVSLHHHAMKSVVKCFVLGLVQSQLNPVWTYQAIALTKTYANAGVSNRVKSTPHKYGAAATIL
ncbi:hypothetical protein KXJ72_17985 (plasmid) [Comamonas aquatica]|nr:hypothetical protein KXJ72_17985 [Comamonas aquatica]